MRIRIRVMQYDGGSSRHVHGVYGGPGQVAQPAGHSHSIEVMPDCEYLGQ